MSRNFPLGNTKVLAFSIFYLEIHMSVKANPITPADFAHNGATEQKQFFAPAILREDGSLSQGGHCTRARTAQQQNPNFQVFIHDATLYNRAEHMNKELLGRIMHKATAEFLDSINYGGARSNSGTTMTPLFTVGLAKIRREFGDTAVITDFEAGFRGVRNEMRIKARFITIMDELFNEVIESLSVAIT